MVREKEAKLVLSGAGVLIPTRLHVVPMPWLRMGVVNGTHAW